MDNRTERTPASTPTKAPKKSIKNAPVAASTPPANSKLNRPVINAGARVFASVVAYAGASSMPAIKPVIAPDQFGEQRRNQRR